MALDQIDIEKQEMQMTFLEHLEVLRWHLIRSVVAILIGAIICFANGTFIFDKILLAPTQVDFWLFRKLCELSKKIDFGGICIDKMDFVIKTVNVQEQFMQHVMIGFLGGFILALPYILYEIYRFIKPALKSSETKYSGVAIFFASLLFFVGITFGYFVLAPISINFLGNYTLSEVIEKEYTVSSVISVISLLTVGAGIIFELPLVIYILSKIGIVTADGLRKYRKIAVTVILVVSAFITPPDVASQILLGIPIYLLYEIGILVAAKHQPKEEVTEPAE